MFIFSRSLRYDRGKLLLLNVSKFFRFSLLQKEDVSSPSTSSSTSPVMTSSKEMQRHGSYDGYYNYDDYLLDDDTVKVEMNIGGEEQEEVTKPVVTRGEWCRGIRVGIQGVQPSASLMVLSLASRLPCI